MPKIDLKEPVFATDGSLIAIVIGGKQHSFKPGKAEWLLEVEDLSTGVSGEFDNHEELVVAPLVTFSEPQREWGRAIRGGNIAIQPGETTELMMTAQEDQLMLKGKMKREHFQSLFEPAAIRNRAGIHIQLQVWQDTEQEDEESRDRDRHFTVMQLGKAVPVRIAKIVVGN
jgi:hypothetical protein